jgi:hypothetical protein
MAYSPIAFTAANYRDYKNYWLKAYEPGSTTPKVIATDSTLGTLIAKAQINVDGFIISSGEALITPYVDGSYDLWLFPTAAEADANDTSSALRLADNITGSSEAITSGDAAVTSAFIAADVVVTSAFIAADVVVTSAFIAADAVVTDAFVAADTAAASYLATATGASLIGSSSGSTVQQEITALISGQISGVIVFTTYALLDAYTPTTTEERASFKVTNDPTSSLNGYYSWVSGTVYTKDADLVVNTIDAANTSDAVSGSAVANVLPIDYFNQDFEVDLLGAAYETDENLNIIRRTSGTIDEFNVPVSLTIAEVKADIPLGGFKASGSGAPVNPDDLTTKLYVDSRTPTFTDLGYEDDLCGFFHTIIGDGDIVGFGLGLDGGVTFHGDKEVHLANYEPDLCGYYTAIIDDNERVLSGTAVVEPVVISVSETTSINSNSDTTWLEVSGTDYSVKAYNSNSGITVTIGDINTNHDPVIDNSKRIVYVRDNVRYWQALEGTVEYPFNTTPSTTGWGDSMTAAGSGYSDIFAAAYPQYNHDSEGMGGQLSYQISARAGGYPVVCSATGNQIPATGAVDVVINPIFLLDSSGGNQQIKVEIAGVAGVLYFTKASTTYTFTRDAAGAAVSITSTEPVAIKSGLNINDPIDTLNSNICIYWAGRNDVGKVGYNQAVTLQNIKDTVATHKAFNSNYLVLGVTNGWADDGNVKLLQINDLNTALSLEFGDRYVDMITRLGIEDPAYITPLSYSGVFYDALNSNFTTDGIHGNTAGRTAVSKIIYDTLQSKGWY